MVDENHTETPRPSVVVHQFISESMTCVLDRDSVKRR